MTYLRLFLAIFVLWGCACLAQIGPSITVSPLYPPQGIALGSFLASGGGSNVTTFSGVSFGAADPTRYIVVVGWVASGSTLTGMTIGGVSATNITSTQNGVSQLLIAKAAVPSGTTGNIVFSYSGTGTAIYAAYRVVNATTGASVVLGTADGNLNVTPTIPAGSFVIGGNGDAATGARTWTGVTQDVNQVISTSSMSSASRQYYGGGAINFAVNGTSNLPTSIIVAMRP